MTEQTVRIPHFQSKEEFLGWWEGADIKNLRRTNPAVAEFMHTHPLVKPWLDRLKSATGASQVSAAINKTFGKYLIERKLGQGGMGAVYLARDTALDRKIAIKIISSDDQETVERFQREAQAVAKLKHPNIVQIYEAGTIDKQHYFTMDYIQGLSLDRVLQSRKLPYDTVARITVQVALALHYAHRHNIIHRDIKPGNILIDVRGKIYLTDFGLAKQLAGLDRSLTVTGTTVGTPDYMSPEQAQGKKELINQFSDIFSLGATLFHCLTGQLPFPGDELLAVLSSVVNKDTPLPSRIDKNIPKDLETICLKCMEKDQSRRYQNMQELALDIRRYLKGEPITARRASAVTRLWYKVKRNKAVSLILTGFVLFLIGLAVWQMVVSYQASRKAELYYLEAQELYDQGKYDDARAICEKIMEIVPYHLGADDLIDMCVSKLRAKDRTVTAKEAQLDLRAQAKMVLDRIPTGSSQADSRINIALEALNIDPSFGEAYQVLGNAYKEKGEYNKAFDYFTKAIEATPTLAYAYYGRACISYYIRNKKQPALEDLKMVIQLDPKGYIGFFAKGLIEQDDGLYDQAIQDYTSAIELNKADTEGYCGRGSVGYKLGNYDGALADYNEAIRLDPASAYAYNCRGLTWHQKGDIKQALADYDKALQLTPDYAGVYVNRAILYREQCILAQALDDINQAIKIEPDNADAYNARGTIYTDLQRTEDAIKDYDAAISIDPNCIEAYVNRGNAYNTAAEEHRTNPDAQKGLLIRAMSNFDQALKLSASGGNLLSVSNIAVVCVGRGNSYRLQGELDKAIADYTEAIKLNRKLGVAYIQRGKVYYDQGFMDKSLVDLNEAIWLNASDADAYDARSATYAAKGEFKLAIADAEMFLKLTPNAPNAVFIRATIDQWRALLEKEQQK
jgi:serine/threonine-protein kinase